MVRHDTRLTERSSTAETAGQCAARLGLAALLGAMGVAHLAARPTFEALIPSWVPGDPAAVNYAASAAELTSAVLLSRRATARWGGMAAFATFAVVWAANLQHAVDGHIPRTSGWLGSAQAAYLRAPLQLPLLWWAWRVSHHASARAK